MREKDNNNTAPTMARLVLSNASSCRTTCTNECFIPIPTEQGISETVYILNKFLQLVLFFSSCSVFSSVLQNHIIVDSRLCTHLNTCYYFCQKLA